MTSFPPPTDTLPPDVLQGATRFNLGLVPADEGAKALTTHVAGLITAHDGLKRRPSDLLKLKRAVGAVVGNVLTAWRKGQPVYRTRESKTFTDELVGHRQFIATVDGLKVLGLLHSKNHINRALDWGDGPTFSGLAERLWPTAALVGLAETRGVTVETVRRAWSIEFSTAAPSVPAQVIEQRPLQDRRRGGRKPLQAVRPLLIAADDSTAQRLSQEVHEANDFAAEHQLTGCIPPRWKRVFGPSWLLGGRWYCLGSSGHYQGLSQSQRAAITVNGQRTVEVDLSAAHLSIMLGLLERPLPHGDPYGFDGIPRWVVKKWITATLGNGSAVGAKWPLRALAEQPELGGFDAWEIGAAIKARYPFLGEPAKAVMVPAKLGDLSGIGTPKKLLTHRLMAIEADALSMAMRYLRTTRRVLALPVHDSLVVPATHAKLAQETLGLAFHGRAGVSVRTKLYSG